MGRVVDGKWMSEDEILDADPVAGPLGRKVHERLDRLGEDMRSGYSANVSSFRDRLRARLAAEGGGHRGTTEEGSGAVGAVPDADARWLQHRADHSESAGGLPAALGTDLTVVWEYSGPSRCETDEEPCTRPARWVVQTGTVTHARHRVVCDEHRPTPERNPP